MNNKQDQEINSNLLAEQSSWRFETTAVHAGMRPDPSTGAIMTPIYQTSTFVLQDVTQSQEFEYARADNPT